MSRSTPNATSRQKTRVRKLRLDERGINGRVSPIQGLQSEYNWGFLLKRLLFAVLSTLCCWRFLIQPAVWSSFAHQNMSIPAFEVVDLPGRGKGAIATRDIQAHAACNLNVGQQGELLIREAPLFVVPDTIKSSPTALISHQLSLLSHSQRTAFYALSHISFTPGFPSPVSVGFSEEVALSIFQTNAIAAGTGVGIFPRTARLNHGCSGSFNSVYHWRQKEAILVVHAIKAIKRGEELLTTYTDTKRPRLERQHFLKEHYDFACGCGVCSLPTQQSLASDSRLRRMASLYTRFASWAREEIDGEEAVNVAKMIWDTGEEEGYWSERGTLAADVAHVAASHSDGDATILWAKLALRWYAVELGDDSEQAEAMRHVITNPRSHPSWGIHTRMKVGNPDAR